MENRSYALATGVFVLVLGAALLLTILWFAEDREVTRDYILVSEDNIGNLNTQAAVRFRGITAGKVTDIRLNPKDFRQILVTISIREDLPLTKGTTAKLASQGVTGVSYIQLDDFGGDPRPLVDRAGEPPRLALQPSVITLITEATLDAMQALDHMSRQLEIFLSEENRGRFEELLVQLGGIADGVDRALGELPATLAAIQELVGPENRRRLEAMLDSFEQAGAEAVPAIEEMRQLMASLATTGARIEEAVEQVGADLQKTGEHLQADTLPRVDRLLEEMNIGSRRLGYLLEELEMSPQLLLRGREVPEPGPGEAGR